LFVSITFNFSFPITQKATLGLSLPIGKNYNRSVAG